MPLARDNGSTLVEPPYMSQSRHVCVHMVWKGIKALRQQAQLQSSLHSVVTLTCTTAVTAAHLAQPDPAAVEAAGLACAAGSSGPAQSPVPWLDVPCHYLVRGLFQDGPYGDCGS
jgi:hypothetical protein